MADAEEICSANSNESVLLSYEELATAAIENESAMPQHKVQSTAVIENADVEFEVEEKLLKANRSCLSMISPVFRVMFNGNFKERRETKIPLPGKVYNDMVEFVDVTHAGKAIDGANVESILPLANEYDCKPVLHDCEQYLLLEGSTTLDGLLLASTYKFERFENKCINNLLSEDFSVIRTDSRYRGLSSETKVRYLERKMQSVCTTDLDTFKKVQKIYLNPLTNVICSDINLSAFKSQNIINWPEYTPINPQMQNKDHIAASQIDSCDRCMLFKFWAIHKVFKPYAVVPVHQVTRAVPGRPVHCGNVSRGSPFGS